MIVGGQTLEEEVEMDKPKQSFSFSLVLSHGKKKTLKNKDGNIGLQNKWAFRDMEVIFKKTFNEGEYLGDFENMYFGKNNQIGEMVIKNR